MSHASSSNTKSWSSWSIYIPPRQKCMCAQIHAEFGVTASFPSAQFNCVFQSGVKGQTRASHFSQPSTEEVRRGCPQTGVKSPNEDTIYNSSSLNVSFLTDVQLNKLPKATWVVVVNSLCIAKSFHNWAVKIQKNDKSVNAWPACRQFHMGLMKGTALWKAQFWQPPQPKPTSSVLSSIY